MQWSGGVPTLLQLWVSLSLHSCRVPWAWALHMHPLPRPFSCLYSYVWGQTLSLWPRWTSCAGLRSWGFSPRPPIILKADLRRKLPSSFVCLFCASCLHVLGPRRSAGKKSQGCLDGVGGCTGDLGGGIQSSFSNNPFLCSHVYDFWGSLSTSLWAGQRTRHRLALDTGGSLKEEGKLRQPAVSSI